jgi:predicted membrane-bound spermidine synthase|tara:strand:- start:2263 stop:4551 length:2289 start_codon:yes stop_codon:yes gene_type:complete
MLAALSGACGLAYELLYIRVFSNYFGDSFLISGVTLCAVFLGMSFGAWQSFRFLRWLAWIEVAIGVYAFFVATAFSYWGFQIAGLAESPWMNAVKLSVLLGIPAFLIGTCVPLFSVYARRETDVGGNGFARIYGLYNVGAFMSVLAVEFVLFRHFGLQVTFYFVGGLNLIVGSALLILAPNQGTHKNERVKLRVCRRVGGALFLASFASGVFQLFILQMSFSIFGPLHENFAIILASAIVGVAIGAGLAFRRLIGFVDAIFGLVVLMLALLVLVPAMVQGWSSVAGWPISDATEIFLKILLLAGFPLPLFILFGALVPLAVLGSELDDVEVSGQFLAISSLGNGLGALAMFVALYRMFELPQIGIGMAGLLLCAAMLAFGKLPAVFDILKGSVIATALIFASVKIWPYTELLLGYRVLMQPSQLEERLRNFEDAITYKAYDQSASLLSFQMGGRSLVFNGYHSLSFGPHGKSDLHETIVGATPALFVENIERALVLGLGTGISAGASARIFDQTDVVEINPAILNIPKHFEEENYGVMHRSDVTVSLQDGISTLLNSDVQYDAIINTVTSPKYYAASKLYTVNFLTLAKSRLSAGGVYSSWFDLNIDRDGIAIMLNTLEKGFAHCRYFVLTGAYFNAVCGDHPLLYQPRTVVDARLKGQGFDETLEKHGFLRGFAVTMSALEVSFAPIFFGRKVSGINSLDRPLIEFVVARNADKQATKEALSQLLLANIELQRKFSGGRQTWKENCQVIAQMSYLGFSGCD